MAITENQVVTMNYELKIDGEVVDGNAGKDPLEFTYGIGQLIPGLEARMADMNEGESREITVPADEAYGEYNPQALQAVPKAQFGDLDLFEGMPLQGQGENGETIQVIVNEIKDNEVIVDYNHPLAGKELNFSLTVITIL